MIELRKDELLGRVVYVTEQRWARPNDFRDAGGSSLEQNVTATDNASCPFCLGHEAETPPECLSICDSAGDWQVRVVPNKFPILSPDPTSTAFGVHEVVIESPRHVSRVRDMSMAEMEMVLEAYQQRLKYWREFNSSSPADGVGGQQGALACPVVFKNVGPLAGASLAHLHSQIAVLPDVPDPVEAELERLEQHYSQSGKCEHCRRLAVAVADARGVVACEAGFLAFCPFVSQHAYETWIVPLAHQSHFEEIEDLNDLAKLLHDVLCRVEEVIGQGGYNLILKTAPWRHELAERWHWRIEIRPRLGQLAGFEFATERFVNHVPPDRAAEALRLV